MQTSQTVDQPESEKVKNSLFKVLVLGSVTRFGDLLHFGQLFKARGTIILPKLPTVLGNFVKVSKSVIFVEK